MARLQDGTRIYGTANVDTALNVNTYFTANASQVKIGSPLSSNGSTGTAGQILVSGGANNAYWGSTTPLYNYSAQFNGSSSLTLPGSTALTFGTGDFTIEFWFKTTATLQYTSFISNEISSSGYTLLFNTVTNDGKFVLYDSTLGSPLFTTSTGGYNDNNWHHFALVRIGTAFSMYVDGVSRASATSSASVGGGTNTIVIGSSSIAGRGYNGFISNWRMVKGVGVYTGAFTVPTSPLQTTQAAGTNIAAITGTQTSLLTCSALSLTDSSSFTNVLTNNGGVVASATTYPTSFPQSAVYVPTTALTAIRQQFTGDGSTTQFNISGGYTPNTISVFVNGVLARNGSDVTVTSGSFITFTGITPPNGSLIDVTGTVPTSYSAITPVGYSVLFNGTNQYFTIPDNTAFTMGTSDFTIEYWAYITSGGRDSSVYAKRNTSAIYGLCTGFNTSNQVTVSIPNAAGNGWTQLFVGSPAVSVNKWVHVALVRSAGTATLYLNGIAVASGAASNSLYDSGAALAIGTTGSVTPASYFAGYISNLRVVKGVAVYTGSFLPTGPLAAVQLATSTQSAITDTQTSLLTCNAPTIVDVSTNAFTITNNGTATVSTSIVPTFTNIIMNSTSADAYNSSTGNLGILFNNTTNRQLFNAYGFQFKDDGGIITPTNKTKVSFYNEAANTWTVPAGVTRIFVKMWGAGGGGGSYGGWRQGAQAGGGGFTHAMFNVVPGEIVQIRPGGRGTDRPGAATAYPDGGGASTGGGDNQYCGNGGGSSSIRIPSISATIYALYAGGGGGGGACNGFAVNNGGAGGGLIGQPGGRSGNYTTTQYGLGGTQSAGGAGGTGAYTNGAAGTAGQGGTHPNTNCYGGGGGGGYYGGGSGAYNNSNSMGGGGGGSGYVHPSAIFGATYTGSYRTPANSQDSDLQPDNALQYGHGGDESAQGGPGVVVFYY